MQIEVDVLGSPSLTVLNMVFECKATLEVVYSELWGFVKVVVAVLGSPSKIVLMVSVEVKQR